MPSLMFARVRTLAPVLAVMAVAVVPGVAAAADTISIADPGTPPARSAFNVTVAGQADSGGPVYLRATKSADCGATYDAKPDESSSIGGSGGSYAFGAFSRPVQMNFPSTGAWRLCAYLGNQPNATDVRVINVREPVVTATISATPSAPNEDDQLLVKLSGTSEREFADTVITVVSDGGPCPAKPQGTGGFIGQGAFEQTYRHLDYAAGPKTLCGWVVDNDQATNPVVYAAVTGTITTSRLPATVQISGDTSPYLVGQQRTFTVSGTRSASGFTYLAFDVVYDAPCPTPDENRDNVDATFSRSATVTMGAASIDRRTRATTTRVCASLLHDGQVYASAEAVLTKLPLPPVTPTVTSPLGQLRDRSPSFRWDPAPFAAKDVFTLRDRYGDPLFLADAKGAYLPPDEEDSSEVDDADGLYDTDTVKPAAREPVEDAGWVKPGGVDILSALPPGSYAWSVARTRSDGETNVMADRRFRILGPKLTTLRVTTRSETYSRSSAPGRTRLSITATPYAYMRLTLTRGGRKRLITFRWGAQRQDHLDVAWTCKSTGGSYRYELVASDDDDRSITRRGTFKPISATGCRALRTAERRARDRRYAAKVRRQQAAARRREAAERAERARQIRNCHQLDGTVRRLETPGGGGLLTCVTPFGAYALDSL